MPSKSKRPCKRNGCPEVVDSGYCEEHSEQESAPFSDASRSEESRKRKKHYGTKRWQKVRKRVLRRDPICQMCEKNPSKEVDHIVPLAEGGDDSMENLQGLCSSCHSAKTIRENQDKLNEPNDYEYNFNTG